MVDVRTLERSGVLPNEFYIGSGVPTSYYETGEVTEPEGRTEYYSCFISHATQDKEFAEKLATDLKARGVLCWIDSENMKGGKFQVENISEAIKTYDKLLLIVSDTSITRPWVQTEIKKAHKRGQEEGKSILFPIRLCQDFDKIKNWELFDADFGEDLAAVVRSYHVPDFSNWKDPVVYVRALDKLVDDLKKEQ